MPPPAPLLIFNVHLLVIFPSFPGSPWKETNTPWKAYLIWLWLFSWQSNHEQSHMNTCVYLTHSRLVEVLLLKIISYFLIKHLKGSFWASWPASLSSSMFYIPEEPREILFNWLISTWSIIKNKTAPTGAALNGSGIHTHTHAHTHTHTLISQC